MSLSKLSAMGLVTLGAFIACLAGTEVIYSQGLGIGSGNTVGCPEMKDEGGGIETEGTAESIIDASTLALQKCLARFPAIAAKQNQEHASNARKCTARGCNFASSTISSPCKALPACDYNDVETVSAFREDALEMEDRQVLSGDPKDWDTQWIQATVAVSLGPDPEARAARPRNSDDPDPDTWTCYATGEYNNTAYHCTSQMH